VKTTDAFPPDRVDTQPQSYCADDHCREAGPRHLHEPYNARAAAALSEPLDWQQIANEMAAEVIRLRAEVDRLSELQRGGGKAPLASHADWTHPLYPIWVGLGLDELPKLHAAWDLVRREFCPKCEGCLNPGPYGLFWQCDDCQLCYIASDGQFAIDTLERTLNRGPDE